jgi:hypothetical protein
VAFSEQERLVPLVKVEGFFERRRENYKVSAVDSSATSWRTGGSARFDNATVRN